MSVRALSITGFIFDTKTCNTSEKTIAQERSLLSSAVYGIDFSFSLMTRIAAKKSTTVLAQDERSARNGNGQGGKGRAVQELVLQAVNMIHCVHGLGRQAFTGTSPNLDSCSSSISCSASII